LLVSCAFYVLNKPHIFQDKIFQWMEVILHPYS